MKQGGSWQFEPGTLPEIAPDLPAEVTPEWAWGGSTGAGVRVAVVDSGVDAAHPDIGRVDGWTAFEEGPDEVIRMTEGPHDDLYGHGTACAAIIRSLAPDAELHSVRVLGGNLKARGSVFAAGLEWAIEHGMHVVNLSLSTKSREFFARFHELADLAYFRGIMLVSAINNVPEPSYPSEYSSVFSVAATADDGEPESFAYNPAGPVEFGAPGIDVDVAWTGGTRIRATGNSFAAPRISGLIARILSKHPATTPFQMKTFLHALARNAVRAG